MRSDKITQQYEEHLGPVNTITFIDNNRRFVSTSDDKKVSCHITSHHPWSYNKW
jgi:pre-mRNA-processing factor 17